MKRVFSIRRLTTFTSLILSVVLCGASLANNQGFPFDDKRLEESAEQIPRYFVKYHHSKEEQVMERIQELGLDVVDHLSAQQVYVVMGDKETIDALGRSAAVEYTEQEPVRKLLSQ